MELLPHDKKTCNYTDTITQSTSVCYYEKCVITYFMHTIFV